MFSCNQTGVDKYCCNDGCSCQENGIDQVVSFAGEPYTISIIGQTGTYPNPSATPTSIEAPASSGYPTADSMSTSPTSRGTNDSALPGSTSSGTTSPSPSAHSSSSNTTAIGIGVGVGLGVALIFGLSAFFFFRRRGRKQRNQQHNTEKLPKYSESAPPKPVAHDEVYMAYHGAPVGQAAELPSDSTNGRFELGTGGDAPARELPANNVR
jgi:hypothetical protein